MTSRLRPIDDAGLIQALGDLKDSIDWPTRAAHAPDPATRVRTAIEAGRVAPGAAGAARAPWWRVPRRALVLALAALLALAAVAGAVGLGLPGLRLVLGGPSAPPITPPPTGPMASAAFAGGDLGLGERVTLDVARARIGRAIPSFDDLPVGSPDAVYLDPDRANQVALVWAASATLPATRAAGVGMIVMSFDGTVEPMFFQKAIGAGSTVEPVDVAGQRGFWISGDPHIFFYESGDGTFVDDQRRWVDDALVWADGTTTYRIETAQGREAALGLAHSMTEAAPP